MPAPTPSRHPSVRGKLTEQAPLSKYVWFRVGGPAEALFTPADEADLADFLKALDPSVPVTIIGLGSNLLIRDGGVDGVVVRLGSPFRGVRVEGTRVIAGAGATDASVAKAAAEAGVAGLEFLIGVPGAIGGAVAMNAGAYGAEVKDALVCARAVTRDGDIVTPTKDALGLSYRHCEAAEGLIFTEATFEGRADDPKAIRARMREISETREATQPIRERTGGSTFANPNPERSGGRKAWELIDAVGARGRVLGDAQVSPHHCNFIVNRGKASAADIEALIESVRRDVAKEEGVDLRWEIRRVGRPA